MERFACVETLCKKPYPLYAWNVETGVLLRHFANPHHEFLVRLSKLNDDGRLLLATAKELLDSTPTFLVVYDTTTGSTVWQVRPESNITAITLCFETDRALIATERGIVHALNIHTGEDRFVITSTSNRIDRIQTAMNKTFLTWDSSSQCRCLRVWDMVTGSAVATFTADYNIHDCLFSGDGSSIALLLCDKEEPALLSLKGTEHVQEVLQE